MTTTIRTEGGLLPPDLLQRIVQQDPELGGLTGADYGVDGAGRLLEAISRSWTRTQTYWAAFRSRREAAGGAVGVGVVRDTWLMPLFEELGYGEPRFNRAALEVDGRRYAISHRAPGPAADPATPAADGSAPPVHTVAPGLPDAAGTAAPALERAVASGAGRVSPHGLLQDYLNRTDHLWGVVTDGLRLRLLRDNQSLSRAAFVEFDLEAMMDGAVYADYTLLWLMAHRSRLAGWRAGEDGAPARCWLEVWREAAESRGARALDALREGVETAIRELGQGFLSHPANGRLRDRLAAGELSVADYYRQLLRMVYRHLFLLAAEERDLLHPRPAGTGAGADPETERAAAGRRALYRQHYSLARLREVADRRHHADGHDDLWRGLLVTFRALREDGYGAPIALPAIGGLFAVRTCPDLDGDPGPDASTTGSGTEPARIANRHLVAAVRGLTWARHEPRTASGRKLRGGAAQATRRRVNYRDMDVEELGSVYEGLLELHPRIERSGDDLRFVLPTAAAPADAETEGAGAGRKKKAGKAKGSERKTSGSYYTHPGLVRELIRTALEPVIAEALVRGRDAAGQRRELLALTVCDPACGSGHFLLAAARRIGRELARVDAGGDEPTPERERDATREVIGRCVYGVDLNPLAVDLCKVALWLEGQEPGRPLGFLDHHIRHGNALVGTFGDVMADGVPDEAFRDVTGDEKAHATAVRNRNKRERAGQRELALPPVTLLTTDADVRRYFAALGEPERDLVDVEAKERAYAAWQGRSATVRERARRDLWTAAFFWPLRAGAPPPPTTAVWRRLADDPAVPDYLGPEADRYGAWPDAETTDLASQIAREQAFFHWDLEFDEVFGPNGSGGFACVLGNPPWERVKLQEQEFFAQRDPEIATAPNAAARKRLIATLPTRDAGLWADFGVAKQGSENQSRFLRASGRFPRTGLGDVNTYSVFAELAATATGEHGRGGIIVPTGIATDDTNKGFFGWLVDSGRLTSLIDFENREGIFPGVHRSYKFAMLGMTGRDREPVPFATAFFLGSPEEARDPRRVFALSAEDIRLFNPNTRTAPIFRSARDAEITRKLYAAAPILVREGDKARGIAEVNPWGVSFRTMFHMSNDSHLFRTRAQLEGDGWTLGPDGRFRRGADVYLPLYEAKLIHQYDHRFATFAGVDAAADEDKARDTTPAEHRDTGYVVTPRYWVPRGDVEKADRSGSGAMFGFRDITRSTDSRTALVAALPRVGVGHTLSLLHTTSVGRTPFALLANMNAIVFDYITRQKVGGTHLSFGVVKQLAVIPPSVYHDGVLDDIVPRVLELTYTSWDMDAFARQVGFDGPPFAWDEDRRADLRADLDAIYAHLYGLTRDEFAHILGSFDVLRRDEIGRHGEFRTERLCLAAYDSWLDHPALANKAVGSVLLD